MNSQAPADKKCHLLRNKLQLFQNKWHLLDESRKRSYSLSISSAVSPVISGYTTQHLTKEDVSVFFRHILFSYFRIASA